MFAEKRLCPPVINIAPLVLRPPRWESATVIEIECLFSFVPPKRCMPQRSKLSAP